MYGKGLCSIDLGCPNLQSVSIEPLSDYQSNGVCTSIGVVKILEGTVAQRLLGRYFHS